MLESWNLYFLQLPYLERYADVIAGKGAPFHNCFDSFRSCHKRVHDVKVQNVVLPKDLIINLLKGHGKAEDMTVYYSS